MPKISFLFNGLAVGMAATLAINLSQQGLENFFYAKASEPLLQASLASAVPPVIEDERPALELGAESAVSLKINKYGRQKILFQKESGRILPIASLSKLMTALVVFKNPEIYDLKEIITVSREAALQADVPEYGNLTMGEISSVRNLLNLMLVHSSNDAAYALAEISGTDDFVAKMNAEAEFLGMKNTRFVNPTGLDPLDPLADQTGEPIGLKYSAGTMEFFNYSTAQDMATLAEYVLTEFPVILEISSGADNGGNKVAESFPEYNGIVLKTGYTDEAGGCLLLVTEKNDSYFINYVFGTGQKDDRIAEMRKMLEWMQ